MAQFANSTKTFKKSSAKFFNGMIATFVGITSQTYLGNDYPALTFRKENGAEVSVTLNDLKREYVHKRLDGEPVTCKRGGTLVDDFWTFFEANKDQKEEMSFTKFDTFSQTHANKAVIFVLDFEYQNDNGHKREWLKYDWKV